MNKLNIYTIFFIALFGCSSCANIIPPSGGAKDTLAPIMIMALPKDSSLNFSAKKITLTFNEFVEAKDIQQNLLVNPYPKNAPIIDYKLNNVFITLNDSLEPNTTYTLNFGNAIKDVNEGNIVKNKTYIFSTGKTIDNKTISGKVMLAETGGIDSTLIVVLHDNLNDSSIIKNKPKYLTKLDGKGNFSFTNLPKNKFNIFVLPNDYSKKYDDTTKLFAFLNKETNTDSSEILSLYAYNEAKIIEKKSSSNNNNNEEKKAEVLKYSTNIIGNKYDILDTGIVLTFSKTIKPLHLDSLQLVDTNFKKIENTLFIFDSTNKSICIKNKFNLKSNYIILVNKNIVQDEQKKTLIKNDTIRFTTLADIDYGNIKIRTSKPTENLVLQVINNSKIVDTLRFVNKEIKRAIYKPGEYELRILIDENDNSKWDAGNYKLKKQPEKVFTLKTKLNVKANWDNEIEIDW